MDIARLCLQILFGGDGFSLCGIIRTGISCDTGILLPSAGENVI